MRDILNYIGKDIPDKHNLGMAIYYITSIIVDLKENKIEVSSNITISNPSRKVIINNGEFYVKNLSIRNKITSEKYMIIDEKEW
jgi:hypothetical protein